MPSSNLYSPAFLICPTMKTVESFDWPAGHDKRRGDDDGEHHGDRCFPSHVALSRHLRSPHDERPDDAGSAALLIRCGAGPLRGPSLTPYLPRLTTHAAALSIIRWRCGSVARASQCRYASMSGTSRIASPICPADPGIFDDLRDVRTRVPTLPPRTPLPLTPLLKNRPGVPRHGTKQAQLLGTVAGTFRDPGREQSRGDHGVTAARRVR